MKQLRLCIFCFLFPALGSIKLPAQDYPLHYFRCPLDIPISLAGNYGEIRPNHFHAGLDLKTGREGLPVHAAADGYISRIKVSATGYGKVIYITHPNGYVSVYGHLSRFTGNLGVYVRNAQYSNESFETELFPKAGELEVKQGDIIALSGNTGNSGGPHVHFEIRDGKTEHPLNPLLFGFEVPDTVKPRIREIVIYPLFEDGQVNESIRPFKIKQGSKAKNAPDKRIMPVCAGTIGFGIAAGDRENTKSGENQVYSVSLAIDGKTVYACTMNDIAFEDSRYVNAYSDFAEKKKSGETVQLCYLLPDNRLGIYSLLSDSGRVHVKNDGLTHKAVFAVADYKGNVTHAEIDFRGGPPNKTVKRPLLSNSFKKPLSYRRDDIRIEIPPHAFYEDFSFSCVKELTRQPDIPEYLIMDPQIPLHESMTLSLKTPDTSQVWTHSGLIVKKETNGRLSAAGGTWKDGWITVQVKELGTYLLAADRTPPLLSMVSPLPLKTSDGVKLGKGKLIRMEVSDNLSGIKSYRASIDGKWVLMEYEPKQKLLFIDTEEAGISRGNHLLEAEVSDGVNNKTLLRLKFIK